MSDERMSRADILVLVIVLALAGIVVSVYLTWRSFQTTGVCLADLDPTFNCSAVTGSNFGRIGPIPTAAVGLGGFVVLLLLAVLALRGFERIWSWSPERWLLAFGIAGAVIGLGLTFIEIFVIHAVCLLCVAGFAFELGILGLAVVLERAA